MDGYLAALNEIQSKCEIKDEDTLLFYTRCLLKLHHAYYKIEETAMLSYIHQIIFPALPLVEKYFLNRANRYLDSIEPETKLEVIGDIEISIRTFCEVCETIIQSTNSADRMLIQSAPIELGLILSPVKICAYFSSMLNALAEIFQETPISSDGKNREYAFSVYPSLVSRPYVDLLFDTMPERGKVAVIKIPGKDISDIRYLRMLICHEFYHIVPGAPLRKRKFRAELMEEVLMYDFFEELYEGTDVPERLRSQLNQFLSEQIKRDSNVTIFEKDISETDRRYYSTKMYNYYANHFMDCFSSLLDMDDRFLYRIFYNGDVRNLNEYREQKIMVREYLNKLQTNALSFLQSGNVQAICRFHTDLFREIFSDLLYVLTLKVIPIDYCLSFRCNPQPGDEEIHFDMYSRIALVFCIMREIQPFSVNEENFLKSWSDWVSLDWLHADYDSKVEMFTDENNRVNLGTKPINWKYILGFMANVWNLICKYELPEDWRSDYVESENDKPGNGAYSAWEKDSANDSGALADGTDRVTVFRNRTIWESYKKYGLKCQEEFRAFENRNGDIFAKFRARFFINIDSNMKLLSKIGMREWEDL